MPKACSGTMAFALLLAGSSFIALGEASAQVAPAPNTQGPTNASPSPQDPNAAAPQVGASGADAAAVQEAQTAPPEGQLGDIIVTAQKRSTTLQRTPISVTALDGDLLQQSQIRNLTEVKALVPAMQMGDNGGYAQITIRGIGISAFVAGADSAVALNMNDVYVSRPIAQLTGLYDVASLEALRGPQGTLYGRNATAGSINVTTARPTSNWSGYGRLSIGNFGAVYAEGAVGGPIVDDVLMFRVAGFVDRRDGYGRNVVTGNPVDDKNSRGIRGTLVFAPTSNLKATLIADYFHERDNGASIHYFGGIGELGLPGTITSPPLFEQQGGYTHRRLRDTAAARDSSFYLRTASITGIAEWHIGDFSVKSITGYRDQKSLTLTPLDGGSTDNAFYYAGEPAHQFSEELQGNYTSERLNITAGLFYFKEKDASSPGVAPFKYSVLSPAFGLPALPASQDYFVDFLEIGGTIRTRAKAAFGEISYEVLDGLTVTGGLRYSNERKENDPRFAINLTKPWTFDTPQAPVIFSQSTTFDAFTPKIGIQYQATPRTLFYATYAKGFKSGGYDITTANPAFEPEKLTDYEGGVKTTILNNKLRLALSGFYYDYTNLQVLQIVDGVSLVTVNAASARVYGSELEFTGIVSPSLQIYGSASYLNARYRRYVGPSSVQTLLPSVDFSGRRLNNAPDFSGTLGGTYTWLLDGGSLALRGEANYSSKLFFTPDNIDLLGQGAYAKGNAFLTYTSDKGWHATAFVRNITNYVTKVSGNVNSVLLGGPVRGAVSPPRTVGFEIGYKF